MLEYENPSMLRFVEDKGPITNAIIVLMNHIKVCESNKLREQSAEQSAP